MTVRTLSGYGLRQAALAADALLRINAAQEYGLVEYGPINGEVSINVDRCEAVIAEAREAGLAWSDEEIDGAIAGLVVSGMVGE